MANPYIGFRCPQDIHDTLEKYLDTTGQEKTEYIIGLIRKDLGIAKIETLAEKVESHDKDIKILKEKLNID